MISLAPFFITFILFEQTKGMFDAWLSTLFNYMIQPTLLLIFFLLIEQMVSGQILKAVATACWGTLIPIEIGLNLNHIGIPINFSFPLPFLPGIPFFIPQIDPINTVEDLFKHNSSFMVLATSSLLFYSYCLMSYGLIEYMSTVISMLTNVMPARQEGQRTDMAKNPIDSVKNDLGKAVAPIKGAASSAGEVFKRKVIDQDYRAKDPENKYGDKPNYGKKIQGGSRLDVPKKEDK
jgi:type IV secretion system protein VirB6